MPIYCPTCKTRVATLAMLERHISARHSPILSSTVDSLAVYTTQQKTLIRAIVELSDQLGLAQITISTPEHQITINRDGISSTVVKAKKVTPGKNMALVETDIAG